METVSPVAQDDSSGANPNSVKSEDSSPQHESGRGSPPPNCAICLGTCKNKSFTDSCLHQFCFTCLLTWSKVKAECPLCKQNFKSIIHNVRSNHQYEEYMVEQRETEEDTIARFDIDNTITQATRRFRYRTTLTLPRRDSLAIQQLLLQAAAPLPPRGPRRRSPGSFRRTVYRHNLYARPLPDFTGRFRDCSPQFYRYNDTQMHRLVPWLNRELHYLLNENIGHISYVITRILELLPQYHINSPEFRAAVQPYFRDRTEHFLHELYCFASTPYDMTGYDRNVQYTTDTRISTMINEVISSSESDASVDSDIVMVSSSEPAEAPPGPSRVAGPSRVPQPVYPHNYIAEPSVIPIETISHSDTDDDSSEVMVVGYIKPPQDRTPEVVDLLGSDSDVIVQDTTPPPQPAPSAEQEPGAGSLVKLILKRHMAANEDSSDNDSTYRPRPRSRRRRRSGDTATTSDTWRSTPEPPREPWLPQLAQLGNSTSDSMSSGTATTPSSKSSSEALFTDYSSSSSLSSDDRRSRPVKKKTKRKSRRETASKEKKKSKKRTSRPRKDKVGVDKDKKSKRKTSSGKGVKSSKKHALPEAGAPEERPPVTEEQPSTSGTSNSHKSRSDRKRRRSSRSSRENKRLKSVVNVINKKTLEEPSSSSTSLSSAVINPNSTSVNPSSTPPLDVDLPELQSSSVAVATNDYTDSDCDDLPLNLSVQKTFHYL
ncbi:E3 ubiquitin-protein ligase Topors [Amyelois transitella]|uniref:E3 ubiquitin-protein ligase Topors n=1 Tax=Amyelois transitella TaxID=680683 RepID=UPI00298FC7B9|nr:E3 ubiquitin-protein ligase Topors [Amyelois transitella]